MAAVQIPENYQLKWHSFGSHLHNSVASALYGDRFADIILHTIDGHQIQAHRFILSACSQYLHQVLKIPTRTSTSLPLAIILPPEINYKTLKILIQYMYSGEATVSKDILENVLRGGDLLKVKGLWRPPEDENPKKNVTIQQKQKEAVSNNNQNLKHAGEEPHVPLKQNIISQAIRNFPSENENKDQTSKHLIMKEAISVQPNEKENDKKEDAVCPDENLLQFLVIKEEPLDWNDSNEGEMQFIEDTEALKADIKPEVIMDDDPDEEEQLYSPLTCELCSETFKLPADWVRHIQTHTDMLPAKRQRRGGYPEEDNGTFPPLHCDMCSKYFPTPAEWVHHIQDAHTEFELHLSNKSSPKRPIQKQQVPLTQHKICTTCNKKFPSHASMLIHKRTHTGERPYMCQYCSKGFNVKSNLLRHLRTLHDRIINSGEVTLGQEDTN